MIPLRDNVPRLHPPVVVWAIIALNVAAFLFELSLGPQGRTVLIHLFGVVPARFFDPSWSVQTGLPGPAFWPAVTYMFLHAGWLHLILNMWVLWVFADNVEDVTGHLGFLAFYLLCGLAALGVHLVFSMDSQAPILGASGAIAGVMGAYLVLFPKGKVLTLIPIFIFPWFVLIPAPFFLGLWFFLQFASGLFAQAGGQAGGVAWWAHVGGFLAGVVLIRFFRKPERCVYCYDQGARHYTWDR